VFGSLDGSAIAQVVEDAAPPMRDADELHDALLQLVLLRSSEVPRGLEVPLFQQGRVAWLERPAGRFLVPAERGSAVRALFPELVTQPPLPVLDGDRPMEREAAVLQVVRGYMEMLGPTTAAELARRVQLDESEVNFALHQLESTGNILRGQFRPPLTPRSPDSPPPPLEWCDRRLLQRIHRLTVGRLRKEIEPLSAQDFMRFLFRWHHLEEVDALRGSTGLLKAVSLLQGYEAPASAWERHLLPARMKGYVPDLLERACYGGEVAWGRLTVKDARPPPGPRRA